MTDDPFRMTPEEIAMWLSGGADPGAVRHEQAKAALAMADVQSPVGRIGQ